MPQNIYNQNFLNASKSEFASKLKQLASSGELSLNSVNGPGYGSFPTAGFALAINGSVESKFLPQSEAMPTPHDIALTKNGKFIFVAQLRPHRILKVSLIN